VSARRAEAAHFTAEQFGMRFAPVERAEFANAQLRTAGSLVALMATHS
jgi:hypothetical protein